MVAAVTRPGGRPVPGEDEPLDDEDLALLAELARLHGELDPPPAGLVERTVFALELDSVEHEVALLEQRLGGVGAARTSESTSTITFSTPTLSVMITVTPLGAGRNRVDGWVAPGADLSVELRRPDGSRSTPTDDTGRFEFTDVPSGRVQLVLDLPPADGAPRRQVVTPAVEI